MTNLLASAYGGTVADDVWNQFRLVHTLEQVKSLLPLRMTSTSTDGGINSNDVGMEVLLGQRIKQIQCQLPLTSLPTCTDACVPGDHVLGNFLPSASSERDSTPAATEHISHKQWWLHCSWWHLGRSLALGKDTNKVTAFCHSPPFSQALIVALKVVIRGSTLSVGIASNIPSARSHWPHLSNELMIEL